MKNILLLVVFISLAFLYNAQGNLQFNQVINGSISGAVSTNGTAMGTIVVPIGKVLKIESVAFTYPQATSHWPHTGSFSFVSINTHIVYTSTGPKPDLPLWLSEGTYNINARVPSNQSSTFSYSAIEFNIVP
jgi:hypothetical protein